LLLANKKRLLEEKNRITNTPAHPFCPNKNNQKRKQTHGDGKRKQQTNYRSGQEIELELCLLVASKLQI
jgi:hypothetical protein